MSSAAKDTPNSPPSQGGDGYTPCIGKQCHPSDPYCLYPNCQAALRSQPGDGGRAEALGALLTADEVMAEIAEVASRPVLAVLRDAYAGKGRFPEDKGKIADVVCRDLALEPVTMYRRKVAKSDAPIRARALLQKG